MEYNEKPFQKEIKDVSKSARKQSRLLIGRRMNQGLYLKLDKNVDPTEPVGNIFKDIEIINSGIEGNVLIRFGQFKTKLPIRKQPIGEKNGQQEFKYTVLYKDQYMELEIDLSQIKTNIGIQTEKEVYDITRNEVFYQKEVEQKRIPNELSLTEIYKESDDFYKIYLLQKRRVFIQDIINKVEEFIKTNNALCYKSKKVKRTPELLSAQTYLNELKQKRDECILKVREIEAEIQQSASQAQKFMHTALKELNPEELERIFKKIN